MAAFDISIYDPEGEIKETCKGEGSPTIYPCKLAHFGTLTAQGKRQVTRIHLRHHELGHDAEPWSPVLIEERNDKDELIATRGSCSCMEVTDGAL